MQSQLQVDLLPWQINKKHILNNISFYVDKAGMIDIIDPNIVGHISLLPKLLPSTIHQIKKYLMHYFQLNAMYSLVRK